MGWGEKDLECCNSMLNDVRSTNISDAKFRKKAKFKKLANLDVNSAFYVTPEPGVDTLPGKNPDAKYISSKIPDTSKPKNPRPKASTRSRRSYTLPKHPIYPCMGGPCCYSYDQNYLDVSVGVPFWYGNCYSLIPFGPPYGYVQQSIKEYPEHYAPAVEPLARRLEQRQKQISYGKNTVGYKRYISLVPKHKRKESDPQTPDKYSKCSKRCWNSIVRSWRLSLHKWDPPETSYGDYNLCDGLERVNLDADDEEHSKDPNFTKISLFGTDILKTNIASTNDKDSTNDNICVYDEPEEKGPSFPYKTSFDSSTLEEKLKIWDEKFERCFRAGPIKGELEMGSSFFSSPFSGLRIGFSTPKLETKTENQKKGEEDKAAKC